MEVWRFAFEKYEVSNLGNVRKNGKIIKGSINNRGYLYIQLQRQQIDPPYRIQRKNLLIHQLVANAFIGDRNGRDTDHINRNKLDNRLENLRYLSHSENMKNMDRYRADIIGENRKKIIQQEANKRHNAKRTSWRQISKEFRNILN
jgi:hypothetical protein